MFIENMMLQNIKGMLNHIKASFAVYGSEVLHFTK